MADEPEVIGQYRIERTLGRGRIGVLYLASGPSSPEKLALRLVVPREGTGDRREVEWLRAVMERRLQLLAGLRCEGLAAILDHGDDRGRLFYVREFAAGESLERLISRGVDLPLANRIAVVATVCDVLAAAHALGLTNLAIEPADVIVGPHGHATVVEPTLRSLWARPKRSMPDPSYWSPEQLEAGDVDRRSDIFSVGALFYEVMTHERPFGDGAAVDVAMRIRQGKWTPNDRLAPEIRAVIARALQPDVDARYQTLEALIADLRELESLYREEAGAGGAASAPPVDRPAAPPPPAPAPSLAPAPVENADPAPAALDPGTTLTDDSLPPLARDARGRQLLEGAGISTADPGPRVDENVRFTVYRPPAMAPLTWYPFLVFAHLGERRPDARPSEPDPADQVVTTAQALLGPRASSYARLVQDAGAAIPQDALLRVVPSVAGVRFNPPEVSFLWTEAVHRAEFRAQAHLVSRGKVARGAIDVWMGAIALARITIAIPVDADAPGAAPPVAHHASAFRRIFASYSHKDAAIVRQFEHYARGVGDSYLRDVVDLRAGEIWSTRLRDLIDGADVFQLFWSTNSMASAFVRREWEHALTVDRPNFLRPVYWESPFPEGDGLPPPALRARHFASVALAHASADAGSTRRRVASEPSTQDDASLAIPWESGVVAGESYRSSAPACPPAPSRAGSMLLAGAIVAILVLLLASLLYLSR